MDDGLHIRLEQRTPMPLAVELSLRPGETLAIVGPSGAGKTTVLRAIAGLHRPAGGRITCAGQVWFDAATGLHVPAHARRVGFVFQAYALFPHMTALQNVAEAMRSLPRAEREARAAALMRRVHLAGLEARMPRELSGGQQQRVAFARALARDPAVLLLDEPFSAVDQPMRTSLHELIAETRAATSAPIVFVSHDVADAARSAGSLCFLRDGASVETGPTQVLLDDPASAVSRWLGQVQVL